MSASEPVALVPVVLESKEELREVQRLERRQQRRRRLAEILREELSVS